MPPTFIGRLAKDLREVNPLLEALAGIFNKVSDSIDGLPGATEGPGGGGAGGGHPGPGTPATGGGSARFTGAGYIPQLPVGGHTVSAHSSGGGGGGGGSGGGLQVSAAVQGFRDAPRFYRSIGNSSQQAETASLNALRSIESELRSLNDKVGAEDGGSGVRAGGLI